MSLRARLVASFGLVTVVLLLPALFAAGRLSDLRRFAVEERGRHAAATLAVGRLGGALAELEHFERRYVALGDPGLRAAVRGSLTKLRSEIVLLQATGFAEAAGALDEAVRALEAVTRDVEALVGGGRMEEATATMAVIDWQLASARRHVADAAAAIDRRADADFARAEAISADARTATLVATIVCLLLALGVGLWTTRALTSPIRRLASAMAGVAEGAFRAPPDLPYDRWDEIGHLSSSFRAMTRRLAELDRMKTEFVGIASHELKAPINVIKGYAELIEEDLAEEVSVRHREILDAIAEQTQIMARLVSRLMDLSRLEAGSYRMELDEIQLEDLLTGLVGWFEVTAAGKGLAVQLSIEDAARKPLVVDVDLIRDEVLGNLLWNALKFTPEGGAIHVTARGGAGWVAVEVSDSGPGVPPQHRPYIFEKYYQVERSRQLGAGLGLAIAREIVEAHGGTIELVERPGPGATFRFTLPVRPHTRHGLGAVLSQGAGDPLHGGPRSPALH